MGGGSKRPMALGVRKRRGLPLVEETRDARADSGVAELVHGRKRARRAIEGARALADIFVFQVPPSHRRHIGPVVTSTKRAVLKGLRPLHLDFLAPQRAFNLALVGVLDKVQKHPRSASPARTLDAVVFLRRLANPTPPSETGGASRGNGPLRRLAERTYAEALRPLLRDIFERQRLWNVTAIDALRLLDRECSPSRSDSSRSLELLRYLARPRPQYERRTAEWLLSPVWEEVFRRQHQFNSQVVIALEALLLPRLCPVLLRSAASSGPAVEEVGHQESGRKGPLARLRRAARRAIYALDVVPGESVELLDWAERRYRCKGPDPKIFLVPRSGGFPHGWTRFRFRFVPGKGIPSEMRLYFDFGSGFREDEAQALVVSAALGSRFETLQFVRPGLKGLRLDPTEESSAELSIGDVEFQEISKQEALVRAMLREFQQCQPSVNEFLLAGQRLLRGYRQGGISKVAEGLRHNFPERPTYEDWIRHFDLLTKKDRVEIRRRITALRLRPKISIVMPVYNTPPALLRRAVDSVKRQLYPNWELCIADDASTDAGTRALLRKVAAGDSRVRVVLREANGHISAASNSALELASGEFVALLDHDDELSEHALYWVAEEINDRPDAKIIYSDEDKIDEKGHRSHPYFKPSWNHDLFYSQNFVNHLGVYQTELLRKIGGFREGYEGSQDYDVILRAIEKIEPQQIRHIPRVLYHWRATSGSVALNSSAKPYAQVSGQKALADHLVRRGVTAAVESAGGLGRYRVRYPIPTRAPTVTLVIPTRDGLDFLRPCVDSILDKTRYRSFHIVIVDNRSTEKLTIRYLAKMSRVKNVSVIKYDKQFNYSAINNAAVAAARGEIVGLVNNDIEVMSPDWLEEMTSHAIRPEIGAVGARLLYRDGTLQHGGVILGVGGVAGHAHKHLPPEASGYFDRAKLIQNFSAVTAACLLVRRRLFVDVGGLDETLTVAFNDIDFCLRLRERGYRNVWTPYAELFHLESASRGPDSAPEKAARFSAEVTLMRKRWGAALLEDPAYNPNLTLETEDFGIAFPPRVVRVGSTESRSK
jgi:glycosyltransferase involved in cell wall biosynthesis